MKKRFGMSRGASRAKFSKGASLTHKKNLPGARMVMRGGIRL